MQKKARFSRQSELKALHKKGMSDREIAARLNVDRKTVMRHRRELGLPSNAYSAHTNARRWASVQAFWAEQELEFPDGVANLKHRVRAARLGWPGFSPSEAIILECLFHNFMTRAQLQAQTELSDSVLASALRSLCDAGYIERPDVGVYRLSAGTEERRTLSRRNERTRRRG